MKIEFAVQMTCDSCVEKVKNSLADLDGISDFKIDLLNKSVIVDSDLPQSIIKDKIQSTGLKTILKGYGQLGSAVAMLGGDTGFSSGNIKGVIRFVQEDSNTCIIDGIIENPNLNKITNELNKENTNIPLNINIHECGDISEHCTNLGNKLYKIFNTEQYKQYVNQSNNSNINLNNENNFNITTNNSLITNFNSNEENNNEIVHSKLENNNLILKIRSKLNLNYILGRSVCIEDDGQNKLGCAVIARSAGVQDNQKIICACDGTTIWGDSIKKS